MAMTLEELTAKLEKLEAANEQLRAENERLNTDNGKLRAANTAACADASKYKKQWAETASAEERARTEAEEAQRAMKEELDALKKERSITKRQNLFLELGCSAEQAKDAAELWEDGKEADVFGVLKAFVSDKEKAITAQNTKNTSRPGSGSSTVTVTKEEFAKMNYGERAKLFSENQELYTELTKES